MTDAERTREALRAAFESLYALFDGARYERRGSYDFLFVPEIPIAPFNGAWPLDDDAAPELEGALDEVEGAGVPGSVQLRAGETAACEREARRLGLTKELAMPVMVVRKAGLRRPEADGLSISAVDGDPDRKRAIETAAEGFGAPLSIFEPIYRDDVLALDGFRAYIARTGDDVVSTSIGYTMGDTAAVFNVATPAAHRGRGYGAAVTVAAALGGFEDGAELVWLQASELGYPVYRRLGFERVATDLLLAR